MSTDVSLSLSLSLRLALCTLSHIEYGEFFLTLFKHNDASSPASTASTSALITNYFQCAAQSGLNLLAYVNTRIHTHTHTYIAGVPGTLGTHLLPHLLQREGKVR